jgi:hypothetical protein
LHFRLSLYWFMPLSRFINPAPTLSISPRVGLKSIPSRNKKGRHRPPLKSFFFLFPIPAASFIAYSYRKDSTGSRLAAWFAGKYPKKSPVEQDTTKAITTLKLDTGTRKFPGRKNCAATGMAIPIRIPSTAPPPLIKNASIRNW